MNEETKKEDLEKAEDKKEISSEELKAQAEALEAENKQLKEKNVNKEAELIANYERRLEKAKEQNARLKETIKENIDIRDLVTLGVKGISEDSDEAKILKKYKDGGIISSYEAGLNHPGVSAEIEALKAEKTAKTIIDENDKEAQAKTSREVIDQYRATGQVPDDKKSQNEIAMDNLKQMGL